MPVTVRGGAGIKWEAATSGDINDIISDIIN